MSKNTARISRFSIGNTENLLYLYLEGDNSPVVIFDVYGDTPEFQYCQGLEPSYIIPNLIECSYKENYEEWMFQESLVWDYDIDFFLLIEIQKFCINVYKNNLYHKFDDMLDQTGSYQAYTHTFEY